jgi:catechol 2,3-dioxygenase
MLIQKAYRKGREEFLFVSVVGLACLGGDYHHHVAVNVWHSNDAGIRDGKRAGLDWFAMEINDQPTIDGVKKGLNAAGTLLPGCR